MKSKLPTFKPHVEPLEHRDLCASDAAAIGDIPPPSRPSASWVVFRSTAAGAARSVAQPDLVARQITFRVAADSTKAENGPLPVNSPFRLEAMIANEGKKAAGSFQVAIYLSADSTISASDVRIASVSVTSLAAGVPRA